MSIGFCKFYKKRISTKKAKVSAFYLDGIEFFFKENIFSKQYKKWIVDFLEKALDIDVKNKGSLIL